MRSRARSAVLAVAVSVAPGAACSVSAGTPSATVAASLPSAVPDGESVAQPTGTAALAELCGAWDAYGATLLALTASVDSVGMAELEVVSAAALVDAIGLIGARWPAELVGERSIVLSDLVGPYLRRAQKALAALDDAGAAADAVRVLALAWREGLAARSDPPTSATAEPDPVAWLDAVVVPADLRDLVDRAAGLFAAQVTSFAADPTLPGRRALVQSDAAPRTEAYLAANCPGARALVAAIEF